MKVSQEQKLETRRKLIDAAAELFVLDGFDKTSMKQIARHAGVGDATVYKYFPNKDKLILGFYDLRAEDAIENYRNADGLAEYTFAEKLQLVIDTYLEQLMADREFVEITLEQLSKSPVSLLKDELGMAKAYKALFEEILKQTEASEEYPDIPMQGILATLFTDYLLGVTLYWIKDSSEQFHHTTQLSDLSIGIIESVIKNGLLNKLMEIAGFIIKTHLVRGIGNSANILSMVKEFSSTMGDHIKQH